MCFSNAAVFAFYKIKISSALGPSIIHLIYISFCHLRSRKSVFPAGTELFFSTLQIPLKHMCSLWFQSRVSTWLGRSKGKSMPACPASSRFTTSVAVAGWRVGSEASGDGELLARFGSPELRSERESAGEGRLVDQEEQQGRSLPRARLKSLMKSG